MDRKHFKCLLKHVTHFMVKCVQEGQEKNAENISLRIFAGGSIFHLGNLLWEADEVGGK